MMTTHVGIFCRGSDNHILPGLLLLGPAIFADFASVELKSHEIDSAAKRIGPVVHLLVSPAQDLCSNPGRKSNEYHVPLR